MSAKSHPASMRFIPDLTSEGLAEDNSSLSSSDPLVHQPSRCLIQRSNGELSLLDFDDGHEQVLTDSVEMFWVTCGQSEEKENLIEEISWLDYGHRGMQVWYPSPGVDPFKQEDFLQAGLKEEEEPLECLIYHALLFDSPGKSEASDCAASTISSSMTYQDSEMISCEKSPTMTSLRLGPSSSMTKSMNE